MQLSNLAKDRIKMASAWLYYYCCMSRMSLYQSVLPKGRRNVPQCFSTQCFSTKCDHVARLNLL
ncbi:hypothetical protein K492DRAFT_170626, partial [Lichtheimia hyalospora FSU 10163]